MKAYACPTCGTQLDGDGTAFRCVEHGVWYTYGSNLLIHAPNDDHKTRDRFTMPWENGPQH